MKRTSASKTLPTLATERLLLSRRVMERLGMTHAAGEDFQHPGLPPGHPLRRHVLYRLQAAQRARSEPSGNRLTEKASDSRSGRGMTSSGAK